MAIHEVVVMQSTTAENTVEKLRSIFANKGLPEVLVSDNGPQFVSGVFNDFMVQNGLNISSQHHTTQRRMARLSLLLSR